MLDRTYTKIWKCFKPLCPWLSETFPFPIYIFHNGLSYQKYQYICLKRKFYWKNTISQGWKLSNDTFWPNPNRKNGILKRPPVTAESFLMTLFYQNQTEKIVITKKLFNLKLFRNLFKSYLHLSDSKLIYLWKNGLYLCIEILITLSYVRNILLFKNTFFRSPVPPRVLFPFRGGRFVILLNDILST